MQCCDSLATCYIIENIKLHLLFPCLWLIWNMLPRKCDGLKIMLQRTVKHLVGVNETQRTSCYFSINLQISQNINHKNKIHVKIE